MKNEKNKINEFYIFFLLIKVIIIAQDLQKNNISVKWFKWNGWHHIFYILSKYFEEINIFVNYY